MKSSPFVTRWIQKYKANILFNRLLAVLSIDVLVKLSGIILLPVFLRLMSQDEFGLYNYLLSIISTFSVVLNFGLYIPLTKFYHDNKDRAFRSKLISTIFSILIVLLTFVLAIVYAFKLDYDIVRILFKNEINYSEYRAPAILAVIVTVLNFMLISFYFTSERIKLLKKYNVARIIAINVVVILLLYWMHGADKVSLRLTATYIIELVLLAVFARILYSSVRASFDKKIALSSMKMASPIMLSAIFGIVINFGDKFFLEKYGNFSDLSVYYLAFSFASLLPMIFSSLQNAWLPIFLKEKDITKNFIQTRKLIRQLAIGFLLLSVVIWAGVKTLLLLHIIPVKYNEVSFVLPILLLSQTISTLIPLYTNYLIYFEKTYIASVTGFFVCLIIFAMSLLLVPKLGIYGAALVSLVANAVYLFIYYFIINRLVTKHLQAGLTTFVGH